MEGKVIFLIFQFLTIILTIMCKNQVHLNHGLYNIQPPFKYKRVIMVENIDQDPIYTDFDTSQSLSVYHTKNLSELKHQLISNTKHKLEEKWKISFHKELLMLFVEMHMLTKFVLVRIT